MRALTPWLAAAALAVACRFDPGGAAGRDGGNPGDPDAGTGRADASGPRPDAQVNCQAECVGDRFRDCAMGGDLVDCPLGCLTSGGPHCGRLVPSNAAERADLDGVTAGLALGMDEVGVIDTNSGEIIVDGEVVRTATLGMSDGMRFYLPGDGTAVLAVDELTLAPGSYLRATGANALIVLSRGDIVIDGVIDVAGGCNDPAQRDCGGPGGGSGANQLFPAFGCAAGGNGAGGAGLDEAGGGGGGLGGGGGNGGDGHPSMSAGGAGGSVGVLCPGPNLVPLTGGSGGGRGGDGEGGDGGGGGGGLQLSSLTRIEMTGLLGGGGDLTGVWAGGAGGAGSAGTGGGGGGGSGGAVLLEAPVVEITDAAVAANGGGGGDGSGGGDGDYGLLSDDPAPGGGSDSKTRGGDGGSRKAAPENGGGAGDGAGGGGGGVGIIRVNAPEATYSLTNATISPQETRGDPIAD